MKNYYFCRTCGNLVSEDEKKTECCERRMTQITEGEDERVKSKHIPTVTVDQNTVNVSVGSPSHPMDRDHLIEWVYLKTDRGRYIKYLDVEKDPIARFPISDERPLEVSAYCNKHGLWRTVL
ncbi:MAG: desulfoferrodoxin [Clostridia bacterium]|nr:desulfoferrodoxin [Clostridia bacterium]